MLNNSREELKQIAESLVSVVHKNARRVLLSADTDAYDSKELTEVLKQIEQSAKLLNLLDREEDPTQTGLLGQLFSEFKEIK